MLKKIRKGDMNISIDNEQDGDIVIDDIDAQKREDVENVDYESENDSETEESSSNKAKDKIKKRNKKLVIDLNDNNDEIIRNPGRLSKKATLFFDQPLFKKVMEEYDEHSETRKSEYDAKNDPKSTPKKTDEDVDYVKNFQANDKDSALKFHNTSLKRKSEEVRNKKKRHYLVINFS